MDNYKDKINNIKKEIELSINKMSFYEETRELKQLLIDKYHELNNKYQEIDSDYEYKKYYVELELFYEHEITRVMDLIINKKKDKSLYDNSDKEVNKKIEELINKLNKEISLMNNFPYFKKIIFLKLSKIINYYQGEEKISEDISKHNVFTDMGIDSNIVLGFGDSKELKKSFLRSLEAIDSYDLEEIRVILANEKRIISLKESLKDNKILSSYAEDILEKYYDSLKKIDNYMIGIYELIIKIQKEVLNNLIELNNKYQKLKEKDNMSHYLNNLIYPQIDIEYLLKIEKENQDNELEELFYEVVYWIITIDKKYNKLNLYEKLSEKTRLKIEQMFIDKIVSEQDEDRYQEYLKNGFLKTITKKEEYLIERNSISKDIDFSIYDEFYDFHEGLARVKKDGKWGYINIEGEEIISCRYEVADSFHEGLARIKKDGRYGYINKEGKEVIPCQYDDAYNFYEGLAKVKINGKYGYINKEGEEKIPCKYVIAYDFYEGLVAVKKDGKWRYINKEGEEVIKCRYEDVYNFSEGLASVRKNWKYGYIDKEGKEVVPCQYDDAYDFHEGLACVRKNWKYGYIDKEGKEVISCQYYDAYDFHEGLARAQKDGKWIYINKEGKEVISCQYDEAYNFHEGLASVRKNWEYGYINKEGKEVVPCQYDDAYDFHEGLARAQKDGKWIYINKEGEEVISCQYEEAYNFYEGLAKVKKNGKWGYINKAGKEVISCQYDDVYNFQEGLARVEKDGKWGYIDTYGNELRTVKINIKNLIDDTKEKKDIKKLTKSIH